MPMLRACDSRAIMISLCGVYFYYGGNVFCRVMPVLIWCHYVMIVLLLCYYGCNVLFLC